MPTSAPVCDTEVALPVVPCVSPVVSSTPSQATATAMCDTETDGVLASSPVVPAEAVISARGPTAMPSSVIEECVGVPQEPAIDPSQDSLLVSVGASSHDLPDDLFAADATTNEVLVLMFTPFFRKLRNRGPVLNRVEFDGELEVATPAVPDYIKEGYFTVFAVKGKETQRYVIELDNLTNPAFLSLLELAQEEYGFQQKGVLCLPCRPTELHDILKHWKLA
ncbi:hypothetical protein GQ457_12G010690 [Hibiscus cannabinus]